MSPLCLYQVNNQLEMSAWCHIRATHTLTAAFSPGEKGNRGKQGPPGNPGFSGRMGLPGLRGPPGDLGSRVSRLFQVNLIVYFWTFT